MSSAVLPQSSTNPQERPSLTSEAVYSALEAHLSLHANTVLSIEILPSSHFLPLYPPFLHDGPSLGIPKKALQQAWLVARKILEAFLESGKTDYANVDWKAVDIATKIILLHTPEHLTAANRRKLLVHACEPCVVHTNVPDRSHPAEDNSFQKCLHDELVFSTTLLTSPLPLHAKSPTLWFHRLWLVKSYAADFLHPSVEDMGKADIRLTFFTKEVEVVLRAAGEHRGNYHAFLYGRRLYGLLALRGEKGGEKDCQRGHAAGLELGDVCFKVQKWCLAHPRDVSGWAFLAFLLGQVTEEKTRCDVITKVRGFVEELRWEGKCVEWFLDMMEGGEDVKCSKSEEGTRRNAEGIGGRQTFMNG